MQSIQHDTVPGRFEALLWQDASAPAVQLRGPGRIRSWVRAAIEHRAAQYLAAGVLPEQPTAIAIGRGSAVDTLALCWLALANGHPLTDPARANTQLSAGDQILGGVKPTTYSIKSRIHPETIALMLPEGPVTHGELMERLQAEPDWQPLSATVSQALRTLLTGTPWVIHGARRPALEIAGRGPSAKNPDAKGVSTAA
ncbi:MAG: hypothetical protein ACE366_12835 [Bradymonadia bacterium]